MIRILGGGGGLRGKPDGNNTSSRHVSAMQVRHLNGSANDQLHT